MFDKVEKDFQLLGATAVEDRYMSMILNVNSSSNESIECLSLNICQI